MNDKPPIDRDGVHQRAGEGNVMDMEGLALEARDQQEYRRRGRHATVPPAERRQRLIDAAEDVFLECGYGSATMDEIARRARMSKKTLYETFESKAELFASLITSRNETICSELPPVEDLGGVRAALEQHYVRIVTFVTTPRQVALQRVLIGEVHRTPELADMFHRAAFDQGPAATVIWLQDLCDRGLLAIADPAEAYERLCGAALGLWSLRCLMCSQPAPSQSQIEHRVAAAVANFLREAAVQA